jgi:hypothetical protein
MSDKVILSYKIKIWLAQLFIDFCKKPSLLLKDWFLKISETLNPQNHLWFLIPAPTFWFSRNKLSYINSNVEFILGYFLFSPNILFTLFMKLLLIKSPFIRVLKKSGDSFVEMQTHWNWLLDFPILFVLFYFETWSHYVSQAGLELEILLPLSLECWDYSHEPSSLARLSYS